jgi:UDP-N-acetylglucosamine acyltransferase
MKIHPTAVIHPGAKPASDVEVGPYAVIEDHVVIGEGCRIMAGAHIKAFTTMGKSNIVHTGAVLGDLPQDLAFGDEESYLHIGDNNRFREHFTAHRGTKPGSATVIGNDCFFMVDSHVAHNCTIGDHVVMVNNALLAGYVEVGDHVTISGGCMVHQFVRIGRFAFMRGGSSTSRDVPPFCMLDGVHTVRGINLVGLQRAGFSKERIRAVKNAYAILFGTARNLSKAMERVEAEVPRTEDVVYLLEFIRSSNRGVAFGKKEGGARGD